MSLPNARFPHINLTRIHDRLIEKGVLKRDDVEWLKAERSRQEEPKEEEQPNLPPLRPLMDISAGEVDPRKTILGNRFLCVGGGMLFVGPSGIGKSSASAQQDILWSLGREAFGIRPQRPLRILTIQSENDDEDLAEMRDGIVRGLGLTSEAKELVRQNVFYDTEQTKTGADFLEYVEKRLEECCKQGKQLDLLRLDPFMGCLGADPTDTEKTMAFLRNGLNPILTKFQIACILAHHTPKTTNRDTSNWRGSDWMYAAAGAADITNWARAVMVIDPTHVGHVFKFVAAKRGSRIGWVNEEGETEIIRHFCHASDGLYWRNATEDDLTAAEEAASAKKGPSNKKETPTFEKLLSLIPEHVTIEQGAFWERVKNANLPIVRSREVLNKAVAEKVIYKHQFKRFNAPAEVHFARFPEVKITRPNASQN